MPEEVVLTLTREDVRPVLAALNEAARPPYSEDRCHLAALRLQAALDEPVEVRREYRVAGVNEGGPFMGRVHTTLSDADRELQRLRGGRNRNVRIVTSMTYKTPWTDLPDTEAQDG